MFIGNDGGQQVQLRQDIMLFIYISGSVNHSQMEI